MAAARAYTTVQDADANMCIDLVKETRVERNVWRKQDPKIDPKTMKIDVLLGSGGFGMVVRGTNPRTNLTYAIKIVDFEEETTDPFLLFGWEDYDDLTDREKKHRKRDSVNGNFAVKHFREVRMYLKGLKRGHENIIFLEAFGTHSIGYTLFLEYADAGTLHSFIRQFRDRDEWPPEGFLWHITRQFWSALAFMQKDHPDYQTDKHVQGRGVIINIDIKPQNTFLKWDPAKKRDEAYPDIKIGDWDGAKMLKAGDEVVRDSNMGIGTGAPEGTNKSKKSDVYSTGATIHYACHCGLYAYADVDQPKRPKKKRRGRPPKIPRPEPPEPRLDAVDRQQRFNRFNDDAIFQAIDLPGHYSGSLDRIVKRALIVDAKDRPIAVSLYEEAKAFYDGREAMMFRPLPNWIEESVMEKLDDYEGSTDSSSDEKLEDPWDHQQDLWRPTNRGRFKGAPTKAERKKRKKGEAGDGGSSGDNIRTGKPRDETPKRWKIVPGKRPPSKTPFTVPVPGNKVSVRNSLTPTPVGQKTGPKVTRKRKAAGSEDDGNEGGKEEEGDKPNRKKPKKNKGGDLEISAESGDGSDGGDEGDGTIDDPPPSQTPPPPSGGKATRGGKLPTRSKATGGRGVGKSSPVTPTPVVVPSKEAGGKGRPGKKAEGTKRGPRGAKGPVTGVAEVKRRGRKLGSR